MKKIIIFILVWLVIIDSIFAQAGNHTPQYGVYYHQRESLYSLNTQGGDAYDQIFSLYPPNVFQSPAGKITTLYLACNYHAGHSGGHPLSNINNFYTNTQLYLGHTDSMNFDNVNPVGNNLGDSIILNNLLASLQPVASIDTLRAINRVAPLPMIQPQDDSGMWVKIVLDNPFIYDPQQSLVLAMTPRYGEDTFIIRCWARVTGDSGLAGGAPMLLKHEYMAFLQKDTGGRQTIAVTTLNVYFDLGFDIQPTDISEIENYSYRVYPNPASSHITIDNVRRIGTYEIYDLSGKKLETGFSKSNEIHITSLPSGIYFLNFINEKQQYQIKFLKE